MPKIKKNITKKGGKYGNLPLPEELIKELRDWKLAYELAWSDPAPEGEQFSMTNEQLIRRLLEGVKRLDPEVYLVHETAMKNRQEQEEKIREMKENFWKELKEIKGKLDDIFSTEEESNNEEILINYLFYRDGEEIPAIPGDRSPFYAQFTNRQVGMKEMIREGWTLIDEVGQEIDFAKAAEISKSLKKSQSK